MGQSAVKNRSFFSGCYPKTGPVHIWCTYTPYICTWKKKRKFTLMDERALLLGTRVGRGQRYAYLMISDARAKSGWFRGGGGGGGAYIELYLCCLYVVHVVCRAASQVGERFPLALDIASVMGWKRGDDGERSSRPCLAKNINKKRKRLRFNTNFFPVGKLARER